MFAVIDVETTGGHLYDDRITEVAIYVTDGTKLIKSFSSLVNPERKITPFVVKLTGITDEMVSTAPTFAATSTPAPTQPLQPLTSRSDSVEKQHRTQA